MMKYAFSRPFVFLSLTVLVLGLHSAMLLAAAATDGTADVRILESELLHDETGIWFDRYGVAHLEAKNLHDLFYAQGYATAMERFFQVDYLRKAGSGRFAELIGLPGLLIDRFIRRLAMVRAAGQLIAGMSPEHERLFQAFVDGINLWLAHVREGQAALPPEYEVLGLGIEDIDPWTMEDSAVIGSIMFFMLVNPFYQELTIGLPALLMGCREYEDLVRIAPPCKVPVVNWYDGEAKEGVTVFAKSRSHTSRNDVKSGPGEFLTAGRAFPRPEKEELAGLLLELKENWTQVREKIRLFDWKDRGASNSWIVSGDLTLSGYPIIASDPHMGAQAYNYLFLCRLTSPAGSWTGANFVGVPGILFGHSDRHAMGFTSLYGDVMDLYSEYSPLPNMVLFEGRLVPVEIIPQRFFANVQGEMVEVTDLMLDPNTYWIPHHGPILVWDLLKVFGLSLRWTGYEPNQDVEALFGAMMAKSFDEYLECARKRKITAANITYADIEGNIHYSAFADFPIRSLACLSPPWDVHPGGGLYEWRGYLKVEDQPQVANPLHGWIVTANNDPTGATFDNDALDEKAYIGAVFAPGFRAARINRLLEALSDDHPLTTADIKDIQGDVRSLLAARFLPHLFAAAGARPDLVNGRMTEALERLDRWNRDAVVDSPESSIFHIWFSIFPRKTLEDNLWPYYDLLVDAKTVARGLLYVLENPGESATGEWLFNDLCRWGIQTREEIILESLDEAVEKLEEMFGTPEMDAWAWGEIHRIVLKHMLLPEFDIYPDDGLPAGFPGDGAEFTVDVASSGIDPDDQSFVHTPLLRFVAEMKPGDITSYWMLASGNGGAGGDHYGDLTESWLANEYFIITDDLSENDPQCVYRLLPALTQTN